MNNNEESYFDQIIGPRLRALPPPDDNGLTLEDKWWINRFEYLKEHRYMMRPRYRPGWKPSYDPKQVIEKVDAEDGQEMIVRCCFGVYLYDSLTAHRLSSILMSWMPFACRILSW